MKIKKVELTNVKCYSNAEFDFENGINFISGINGAGKTSIIESIGFALFDYKVGKTRFSNYFIKKGEKKASVRIKFEDKNENEYIVERKLANTAASNSWIIKDIENEEEIVSGEIDVVNWLKDNLGFYREDNISEIYENIISVPQGMFTSVFLDTAQNRKNKFDPIFNLEIYRTVFKNTASFESGLKEKKLSTETEREKLDVRIEMLKIDENEYKKLKKEATVAKKFKQEKEKEFKELDKLYKERSNSKEAIKKIEEEIEKEKIKEKNANTNIKLFNKDLEEANKAKKILEDNKQGYESYIQEEKKQKELKERKKKFDALNENKNNLQINIKASSTIIDSKNKDKDEIAKSISEMENELKKTSDEIQEEEKKLNIKLVALEQEKVNINELNERQAKLEEERKIIDNNHLKIQGDLDTIKRLEKIINKEKELLEQKKKLEDQIKNKEKVGEDKNIVETKLNELLAKLQHIKESKKIAKDGICPYLKTECINVKGKTEEEYKMEIDEVEKEISNVKQEKKEITKLEKEIIKAETELEGIISKMHEVDEAKKEMNDLQNKIQKYEKINKEAAEKIYQILELNGIDKSLENIDEFKILSQKKISKFNEQDKEYDILKTKLEHRKTDQDKRKNELEKKKHSLNEVKSAIEQVNEKIQEYKEKIEKTEKELKQYTTIEEEIKENEKKLQETKLAYDTYMQKQEMANKVEELKKKLEKSSEELRKVKQRLTGNTAKLEELNKNYNEKEFEELEKNRKVLSEVLVETRSKIETIGTRLEELMGKLNDLKQAQDLLKEIEQKIALYQKVIEYLAKIRQIIKQAPEDISEILIRNVSRKATEIYSKIANDNTTLEWREGYEVILVDNVDGKIIEKEFRQLSGGEQMSAALAIRISMLEILTNLKIGILDEPTVNMDIGRRQRLAEIIESVGDLFVQLCVVSHDDTFNSITENMIQL